jgi:hypothetical protein
MKRRSLSLDPVADLTPLIRDGNLVALNVGPDGAVYLVVAQKPLDYRIEQPGWASFAKTVPDQSQAYRVIGLSQGEPFLDVAIDGERFNIHDIQPLPEELLLVCARSYRRGPDDFEKNGRIYTRGGKFAREILLGDGISRVQVTSEGIIWTGFFDEGIFGNYGWTEPVGASGLIAWNAAGNRVYEFEPGGGLDSICDCYALNVPTRNDVWLYYYTEFPLVLLRDYRVVTAWRKLPAGSDAFAISGRNALFRGGYAEQDSYQLLSLDPDGRAKLIAKIEFRDRSGNRLVADGKVVGRGDAIYFTAGSFLYRLDVRTAMEIV